MELRFTPVALTRVKDFPLGEAMDWVIETTTKAAQQHRIKIKLIVSVNRHEPVNLAEEVIQLAIERKDKGVVGLDLAGNEAEFPGEEFSSLFEEARQDGLRASIHAGEWGGPERIHLAIDKLCADRIGHGVRVMEDSETVQKAKEMQIPFEVCPTSNYQSGVVNDLHLHPLPAMIASGLNVTVNTDDPGISQIDLSNEYRVCLEVLSLSEAALRTIILNGARASFLPEEEKSELIKQLAKELDKHFTNPRM
jgi:adenosine deaminase